MRKRAHDMFLIFVAMMPSFLPRSAILVGNKADLARSRLVQTGEGCDLAVEFGVKFTETSPGMGHHIDELLVGIVMQMR